MNKELRSEIAQYLKSNFSEKLSTKIKKGYNLKDFNIHPFNIIALSSGIFGEASSINIAKSLIYPRVLGTSITTTFGDRMQQMCVSLLGAQASAIPGMDIEFEDKITGKKIIAQMKSGPNTINHGDVKPLTDEMESAYRLLQKNGGKNMPEFAVCVIYGSLNTLSGHYKKLLSTNIGAQLGIPIYIGKDFWERLTGDKTFYSELIIIFQEIFEKHNLNEDLNIDIHVLAKEIDDIYFTNGKFDLSKL